MKPWVKQEIEIAFGTKVMAQMPLIVSASRSTDVPAFYSDWFIDLIPARIFVTIAMLTPTMRPRLKTGSSIVSVRMQRRQQGSDCLFVVCLLLDSGNWFRTCKMSQIVV